MEGSCFVKKWTFPAQKWNETGAGLIFYFTFYLLRGRDRPKFGFGYGVSAETIQNMVSAWFRLRQKGTVELRFRPKLDHMETETSRNWISSEQTVVGNDLPANNYLVQQDKSTRQTKQSKRWKCWETVVFSVQHSFVRLSLLTGEQEVFSLVCNLYYCHFDFNC